ncbi:MAG: hypothetical protein WBA16_10685 [Nonlabens sp.]
MRTLTILLLLFFASSLSPAQVGINTDNPRADLEIVATPNPGPGQVNGIIIPTVTTLPTTNIKGNMVYLDSGDSSEGFYFNNGSSYQAVSTTATKELVRAGLSTDQGLGQSTPGSNPAFVSWNKVTFNSETTSTSSFNETNGVFTAPRNGLYNVSSYLRSTFGTADNERFYGIAIYVNGVRRESLAYRNSQFTSDIRRSITQMIYLNQNDTVEIYLGYPQTFADFNSLRSDSCYLIISEI